MTGKHVYVNEKHTLSCWLKNKGDKVLENVQICIQLDGEQCQIKNVNPFEDVKTNYYLKHNTSKTISYTASAKWKYNNQVLRHVSHFDFFVLEKPGLDIKVLNVPTEINEKDSFYINFTVKNLAKSSAKNVSVFFKFNDMQEEIKLKEIIDEMKIGIFVDGNNVTFEEENYEIIASFNKDDNETFNKKIEGKITIHNRTATDSTLNNTGKDSIKQEQSLIGYSLG